MRSHNHVRESAHFNPSFEHSIISSVLDPDFTELLDDCRSITTNIRMTHCKTTYISVHKANHSRLHTVKFIVGSELITHPHQTSMTWSLSSTGSRPPDNFL